MNNSDLKLAVFISLLGAVVKDMRAIAYDYSETSISIYGYLDREPEENDYNVIDIAITEIMASYPNFLYQNIKLIKSDDPIGKLESYKGWVFARYEE